MMKYLATAHRWLKTPNQLNYKVFSKMKPDVSRRMQKSSPMTLFIPINTLTTSYLELLVEIWLAYVFSCFSGVFLLWSCGLGKRLAFYLVQWKGTLKPFITDVGKYLCWRLWQHNVGGGLWNSSLRDVITHNLVFDSLTTYSSFTLLIPNVSEKLTVLACAAFTR